MTDDSLNPEAELASAALDGDVSPVERARVDASPQLTEQLHVFATLRSELAAVDVPGEALESAVFAALAAFDGMQAAPIAPVISLDERRRRQYRWLTGAAAAVAVLVIGAAVLNSGGDDKKSSGSFDAAVQDSQAKTNPVPAVGGAPAGSIETAGTTAGNSAGPTAINGPAVVTAWAVAPSFTTAAELAAYAASPNFASLGDTTKASDSTATDATSGATSAASAGSQYNTPCLQSVTFPVAAVVYQGHQVLVIRDVQAKLLSVVDPTTCAVVTTIALP